MDQKKSTFQNNYLLAAAWSIGSGIIFFCLIGYLLDQHFHTDNVFILIGFGLGILYTCYEIYKALKSQK